MRRRSAGRQRALLAVAGVLLALFTAGCSAVTLFYQHLDRYVAWRVGHYVTLRPEQQRQLDREFARLWQWHRQHELPLYVMDLRRLATALQGPVDPADVTAYVQRAEQHWQVLARQALPAVCGLVATLDDDQTRELLAGLDRDNARFFARHVQAAEDQRRDEVARRQQQGIERWIGALNDGQEGLLQHWAADRDDLAASWLGFRLQWRLHFADVLAQRHSPQACQQLEPLLVRPLAFMDSELELRAELNGRRWSRLIAAIIAGMDPQQHSTAQKRLQDFATRLEQLVRTSA